MAPRPQYNIASTNANVDELRCTELLQSRPGSSDWQLGWAGVYWGRDTCQGGGN